VLRIAFEDLVGNFFAGFFFAELKREEGEEDLWERGFIRLCSKRISKK
jgi:hypothetical protein